MPIPPVAIDSPPIIVNAERWERDYRQSTSSISHYTEEDFVSSGATTVSEFLKTQAGLNLYTSGAFGKASSLFLRGTSNRHTLVLIDGVRATDLTAIGGGSRLEFLGLQGISEIEILKGSQSVLYGPEAIGGVINITTKKEAKGSAEIRYGSFEDKGVSASLGWEKDRLFYQLNANWRDVEGISAFNEKKGETTPDGLNSVNVDSYLRYEGDKRSVSLQARFQDNEFGYDNFGSDGNNEANYQTYSVASLYEEKGLGFFKPRLQVEYRGVKRDIIQRGSSSSTFLYDGESYRGELTLPFIFSVNSLENNLLFGVNYEKEWTDNLGGVVTGENERVRTGTFLNNRFQVKDIFWEVGGRYEDYTVGGNQGTYRLAVGVNVGNWTFKASQATGFKVASLYQSFSSFGSLQLNPETSLSRELGLTYSSNKTLLDFSVYNLEYENFIDYDTGTNRYKNLSALENNGFELSGEQHFDHFSLRGGYQYLLSRNPDTGRLAPRRAKKRVNLSGTLYPLDRLSVTLSGVYVGERNETDSSRMPSYLLFNASIDYQFLKTHITLSVNNLLDREYEEQRSFGTPDRNFLLSLRRNLF